MDMKEQTMKTDNPLFPAPGPSRRGYPEGFEGEIDDPSQNVMPELSGNGKGTGNYIRLLGVVIGCLLLACSVILLIIVFTGRDEEMDAEGYRRVTERFVETIEKKEPSLFDGYIFPGADGEMKGYMEKVVGSFSGAEDMKASITYAGDKEPYTAHIDLSYQMGGEEYSVRAVLEIVSQKKKWYLSSASFSDTEKKAEEKTAEEVTEEEISESPLAERKTVTVGTDMTGTFEVPDDMRLSRIELSKREGISLDYTLTGTYEGREEMVSIIVYSYQASPESLAREISERYKGSTGKISSVKEKGGDVCSEEDTDGDMIRILKTFSGDDGICRTFIASYPSGDKDMEGVWDSYMLPSGITEEATGTDASMGGLQRVGSESLGYIKIGKDFVRDTQYDVEGLDSIGYTYGDATIVLINYAGTQKEGLSTKEFAEDVRSSLLGDAGAEFETGDWMPGAYYSCGLGEDGGMTEMYAFTGNDGANRLLLLIHKRDDQETAGYYASYSLGCGIRGIEE